MSNKEIKAGMEIEGESSIWVLEEKLGSGGNGEVCLASPKGMESEKRAIKFVLDAKGKRRKRFEKEVAIQSVLDHESIINIYEYHTNTADCWLSMPVCSDASSLLKNKSATEICDKYLNIVSAIKYIHNKNMAHRDIKPDNILNLDGNLLLADFGLISTPLNSEDKRITVTGDKVGNFATIAPELRYFKPGEDEDQDFRPADVYSLAVTLWMLLNKDEDWFDGQYAISSKNKLETTLEDERLELKDLHSLLEEATADEPKLRPNVEEFEKKLTDWIEDTKDFSALIFSKWVNLQGEINPYNANYLAFNDIDNIISILNKIVRNDTSVHHCLLPREGGLDLIKAAFKANGEVRLFMSGGSYYDCLPKTLHYINYQYRPSESYFFLETQPIAKPANSESYEDNKEVVDYTEFANGDLTSIEVHSDGIWEGSDIYQDIKRTVRVYNGSFLLVFRKSLYNLHGPTYDARHSKMGFKSFQSYYPKPYSNIQITPNPPQFLKQNNSWKNDPKFYIYLNFLDVSKILLLLKRWPVEEDYEDTGSENLMEHIKKRVSLDFSFLEELTHKELEELVCIMDLGRDTYGKRITRDTWDYELNQIQNKSYDYLLQIFKQRSPSSARHHISNGLKSLGAEQNDY